MRPAALGCVTALLIVAGCEKGEPPAPQPGGEQPVTIAMMPKLTTIPYFKACEKGAREAAKELGATVRLIYDGPAEDSYEKQQQILDSWIAKKHDVIAVAPVNPESISSGLTRALDRGLHVITYDADAVPEARERFVNQATYEAVARCLVDLMADGIGGNGKCIIISGSSTARNQREWVKRMLPYAAEKYPQMDIVPEPLFPGEDHAEAVKDAQRALTRYPDLEGIFGITSVSLPAAAEAVRQAKAADRVFVTGLATPNDMKGYLKDGTVKTFALWNAVDLGYLTVYAGYHLVRGQLPKDGEIEAGRLGKIQVKGGEVLLGPPLVFTRDNIDRYDF